MAQFENGLIVGVAAIGWVFGRSRSTNYRWIEREGLPAAKLPNDDLYQELRPHSRNDGVTDLEALVAGRAQALEINPAGRFELYRVGDCVSARDIHAAILDSLRLCVTL